MDPAERMAIKTKASTRTGREKGRGACDHHGLLLLRVLLLCHRARTASARDGCAGENVECDLSVILVKKRSSEQKGINK